MAQPIDTCVSTNRIDAESWQALATSMMASARWRGDDTIFVYIESIDDCRLERCAAANALTRVTACAFSDASLFEGRAFDSAVEARWRRLTDGNWAAWIVRELKAPEADHSPSANFARARRTTRRYYLLGTRDKTANHFHEARYSKLFEYPVTNDRVYIEVAEYRRVEPTWRDAAIPIDSINNMLAQPLLFAHRFVRVGAETRTKVG